MKTVDKIIITVFHVYGKSFPESLKIDLRNTALRLQDKAEMPFKERTKKLVDQLAYPDAEVNETEQVISQMVQEKQNITRIVMGYLHWLIHKKWKNN